MKQGQISYNKLGTTYQIFIKLQFQRFFITMCSIMLLTLQLHLTRVESGQRGIPLELGIGTISRTRYRDRSTNCAVFSVCSICSPAISGFRAGKKATTAGRFERVSRVVKATRETEASDRRSGGEWLPPRPAPKSRPLSGF